MFVMFKFIKENWWDEHGMAHRIVLGRYGEHFCFFYFMNNLHRLKDVNLISWEKEAQMVKFKTGWALYVKHVFVYFELFSV